MNIKNIIEEGEKEFDEGVGKIFTTLAVHIAALTGKDENEIRGPFLHRDAIKSFLRTQQLSLLEGVWAEITRQYHLQRMLEAEWTGISIDGTTHKINPHEEKAETLLDLATTLRSQIKMIEK